MLELLLVCIALDVGAAPLRESAPASVNLTQHTSLPEGAIARLGGNHLTALQSLEAVGILEGGKEVQAWDGSTLYRWEFPSGKPLERQRLPQSLNSTGQPFAYTALSPRQSQLAWIRYHEQRERLQVWDFRQKKLVVDCDATLEDPGLDYSGLVWSEDGTQLLALRSDKQIAVFDLRGDLVQKVRVVEGKSEPEFPDGRSTYTPTQLKPGLVARLGKKRIHIALTPVESRDKSRPTRYDRLQHELTFKDLDSGKSESLAVPDLNPLAKAAVSPDGRQLVVADVGRLRIWDVSTRREVRFPTALPPIGQMILSPGGAFVQIRQDHVKYPESPWHSLKTEGGRLLRLNPSKETSGLTLGLGPLGFAVGKREFVGITSRSLDRWDLESGRSLASATLPNTPHDREMGIPYDECLLLGDGFNLLQFTCYPTRNANAETVYKSTWRVWSPEQKEGPLLTLPDLTWQRGTAALPHKRFLYFGTLPKEPQANEKEVQPNVVLRQRGEMQLLFGTMDRPRTHKPSFTGQWCELRGVSRGGHLMLLWEYSSSWIQSSRNSQSTWFDPAAQRHCLLEYHSGEPVSENSALAKLIRDQASHLSHDGRFLLIGGENALRLYEPHVLGKVVKEIPLPATPKRFAVSADGTRIACQLDDATLIVWDGERLARFVEKALANERPKDLPTLVRDLASNTRSAFRAARLLALAGDAGVAALRRGMDVKPPDRKQIAEWLRELDSDEAVRRNAAESSLAGWGLPLEKTLRAALSDNPSAEKRTRLRRLLARLERTPYGNHELAQARAVLALEWNGSKAANKLLAEWAEKFPESLLGSESKQVLASRAQSGRPFSRASER